MEQNKLRNIALIAHVDHGKTTLVDQLFKQSGMFHENQVVAEKVLWTALTLSGSGGSPLHQRTAHSTIWTFLINIIDTPGHADFGGQVERVLKMADGALLLVDAQERPNAPNLFCAEKGACPPSTHNCCNQ